ncbi:MAG: alpha/beta hydrolase [Limnobacter sp.]|nr:alpha/beta hydrolase [Limnobacter sp.]
MTSSGTDKPWERINQKLGKRGDEVRPCFYLPMGGDLAIYGEQPPLNQAVQKPWFVFHGGPGGRVNAELIAPLRELDLSWLGFDQRNSGYSSDLKLDDIDLQLFVDDACAVMDYFELEQVNVLAGSWGATVAMLLACQQPERVCNLVLRAPFIPFPSRIDYFFAHLESLAPEFFSDSFGVGARSFEVCSQLLECVSLHERAQKAFAWSVLEEVALGVRSAQCLPRFESKDAESSGAQTSKLIRKYSLQSHFLLNAGFWPEPDWFADLESLNLKSLPIAIVQGLDDVVCPPDGALLIKESLKTSSLNLVKGGGHLAGSPLMFNALKSSLQSFLQA